MLLLWTITSIFFSAIFSLLKNYLVFYCILTLNEINLLHYFKAKPNYFAYGLSKKELASVPAIINI